MWLVEAKFLSFFLSFNNLLLTDSRRTWRKGGKKLKKWPNIVQLRLHKSLDMRQCVFVTFLFEKSNRCEYEVTKTCIRIRSLSIRRNKVRWEWKMYLLKRRECVHRSTHVRVLGVCTWVYIEKKETRLSDIIYIMDTSKYVCAWNAPTIILHRPGREKVTCVEHLSLEEKQKYRVIMRGKSMM